MIKLEKLEKGEFFEDAFLVSYRYNKDYLNKMRSLKYKRYVPDKKAWEIPTSELKHLVDLFGVDDINVNAKYLEGLVEKEESKAEEAPEDIKERLKDIKPIVDYPFKTKPFPHQIEAFNRGYECKNLLLADDQGLGKTKESIDIAVARKGEIGKCLIVCGVNSVKYNWKKEVSVGELETLAKKLGSDMIIIDQLSLMADQRRADTPRIAYNNISEDAFLMSKRLGKPVIMLAQANREAVKNKKKGQSPELHDLAESDGVAQNATRVISLSVIDGILKLSTKKNRYGINNKDVMVMWEINAGYIKPLLENKEGEKGEAEDYGF